jgi:hypothetical protein
LYVSAGIVSSVKKPLCFFSASACGPSIGRIVMPPPAEASSAIAPAGEEEGVERAVLQLVAGRARLDVLGLDVAFLQAVGGQHGARIDQRAGARLVERDTLALQLGDALDAGVLLDDDVQALGVQVGDQAQAGDGGLAFEDAGPLLRPGGDVALREARLHRTAGDAGHVGERAVARLRGGDDLARLADGVGDHAAHRVVGAGGAAGADAEELLGLRGERQRGGGQQGRGGEEGLAGDHGTALLWFGRERRF